jgi:[ribosomal protein S5]-alanine N-acetyltransferase
MSAIKTSNLLLRPISALDIYPVWKGLSHPEVIRYYGVSFSTLEETRVQMEWYATIERERTGQWWAICDPGDQHFYGAIGFSDIHPVNHRAEIGFWLMPEYWGKGYIPEAASQIIKYGFEQMELHRIYAYVETENANSKKVLQKLGFEYEGTMKESEMKNGGWIDLQMYAVIQIHSE